MSQMEFVGMTDGELEVEQSRTAMILSQQAARCLWLEQAIEYCHDSPERTAFDSALSDAQDQLSATRQWLYAVEDELIERGVKGWTSS